MLRWWIHFDLVHALARFSRLHFLDFRYGLGEIPQFVVCEIKFSVGAGGRYAFDLPFLSSVVLHSSRFL